MPQTTAPKVACVPGAANGPTPPVTTARAWHAAHSRAWLPAEVARRLLLRGTPDVVGRRVLAQRARAAARRDDRAWVYWDVVLIAIERRTSYRFRDRQTGTFGAPVPVRPVALGAGVL